MPARQAISIAKDPGPSTFATVYKKCCSGNSEIAGNLRSGFTAFDQTDSASNLTVRDPPGVATKVLSGFSAFTDGIGDAFACAQRS